MKRVLRCVCRIGDGDAKLLNAHNNNSYTQLWTAFVSLADNRQTHQRRIKKIVSKRRVPPENRCRRGHGRHHHRCTPAFQRCERKIRQFECIRFVDTFAQRMECRDIEHFRCVCVCGELWLACVLCACVCVPHINSSPDNKIMANISAFFDCHCHSFISGAFTVQRIPECDDAIYAVRHNVDNAKYFTCLT